VLSPEAGSSDDESASESKVSLPPAGESQAGNTPQAPDSEDESASESQSLLSPAADASLTVIAGSQTQA